MAYGTRKVQLQPGANGVGPNAHHRRGCLGRRRAHLVEGLPGSRAQTPLHNWRGGQSGRGGVVARRARERADTPSSTPRGDTPYRQSFGAQVRLPGDDAGNSEPAPAGAGPAHPDDVGLLGWDASAASTARDCSAHVRPTVGCDDEPPAPLAPAESHQAIQPPPLAPTHHELPRRSGPSELVRPAPPPGALRPLARALLAAAAELHASREAMQHGLRPGPAAGPREAAGPGSVSPPVRPSMSREVLPSALDTGTQTDGADTPNAHVSRPVGPHPCVSDSYGTGAATCTSSAKYSRTSASDLPSARDGASMDCPAPTEGE